MTDPLNFAASSPRWAFPFLFAGQAQKEIFVNEALARLDALLHAVVEGEAATPPTNAAAGEAWIVGANAGGEWSGHENAIACFQSGQWIFAAPAPGMLAFDRSTGTRRVYDGTWAATPAAPEIAGGATIDGEARTAIAVIVAALSHFGLISQS